jgi:hypothetical protein
MMRARGVDRLRIRTCGSGARWWGCGSILPAVSGAWWGHDGTENVDLLRQGPGGEASGRANTGADGARPKRP